MGDWGEQRILVGDTVQTRRNDRFTGVENRAQWVVVGIHEDRLSLASSETAASCGASPTGMRGTTCSSRTRRPCTECRGHRGRVGRRAGRGCRGLYVGLTRGRVHNLAVVVARSDGAACERVADAMQRGCRN